MPSIFPTFLALIFSLSVPTPATAQAQQGPINQELMSRLISGAAYLISPEETATPVRVPLGYLNDSGHLEGVHFEVLLTEENNGFRTLRDLSVNQFGSFLYPRGSEEFIAVHVYYHLNKLQHYFDGLGLDDSNHVVSRVVIDNSSTVFFDEGTLYLTHEVALNVPMLYKLYAELLIRSLAAASEIPISEETLKVFSLYHAHSLLESALGERGELHQSISNEIQYKLEGEYSSDLETNVLALSGAIWDLRESLPAHDVNRMALLSLFALKDLHEEASVLDAFLAVDRELFHSYHAISITDAFLTHGLSSADSIE